MNQWEKIIVIIAAIIIPVIVALIGGFFTIFSSDHPPVAIISGDEIIDKDTQIIFRADKSYDSDGIIEQYAWFVNEEKINEQPFLEHVFETEGTYRIDLVISDDDGLQGKDTKTVQVVTSESGIAVERGPLLPQSDIQQNQMIKNHISSKIKNVILVSTNLTNLIEETYNQTGSIDDTIDQLRDSRLFHVNTPVPKEIAYFYIIDEKCDYVLYAYDDENLNRKNAIGTEACDDLIHEKEERQILTRNYASTSTFNFVNTFGRSFDLDADGNIDLVLGVTIHWDNMSSEIKNMIFLDDIRYILKDKSNVVVINASQSSFESLKKQAEEQSVYDEDKGKSLLNPNFTATEYVQHDKDTTEQLNGIVMTDNGIDLLVDWSLITRSEK